MKVTASAVRRKVSEFLDIMETSKYEITVGAKAHITGFHFMLTIWSKLKFLSKSVNLKFLFRNNHRGSLKGSVFFKSLCILL